jgi:glycosyltransferase involved in cell wall biosynthesis
MQISVVIPTCNRKAQLLHTLQSLNGTAYPLQEVIIVDSGEDRLAGTDLKPFSNLRIEYLSAEKSVCIQRNKGIQQAKSEWIFLCDDDVEVPAGYLGKLVDHIKQYNAGAVSGQWLQKEPNGWQASWSEKSSFRLARKYIFQLSIWGEIKCRGIKSIVAYYERKGNHVSRAGWPVITQMGGEYYVTPVYTLGASLVKREWLLQSPFDEVLDRHGIGDNYGVALSFPVVGIHIVNDAQVFHHQEPANRLKRSLQYYRRALALDYFARTKPNLRHVSRVWILWSLFGNLLSFLWAREGKLIKASLKAMTKIMFGNNPYYKASREGKKVVEPML